MSFALWLTSKIGWLTLALIMGAAIKALPRSADRMRQRREMICVEAYAGVVFYTVIFDAVSAVSWFRLAGVAWLWTLILAVPSSWAFEVLLRCIGAATNLEAAWRRYKAHRDHGPDDCEYGPRWRTARQAKPVRTWRKVALRPVFAPT